MFRIAVILVLLCMVFTLCYAEVVSIKQDKTGKVTIVQQFTSQTSKSELETNLRNLKETLNKLLGEYDKKAADIAKAQTELKKSFEVTRDRIVKEIEETEKIIKKLKK